MKTQLKKTYEAPSMEVLVVELEQGIAAASLNSSPQIDDTFGQGSSSTGWNTDDSGF
ncbi:hypothetical protein [Sphingobacterium humi]|uniref:Uncharacterized protein n=1 Tax=Sphingobacterium humi TaxID=1796905 RepID=A0A6N8L1N7_9SPHI|nr:hypothetical protein [Sphingobacterium humi]MVZ63633.1 hypothetical protein [Sphingobacterium humi]